jgi:energy-converting hydrogenase Eha subunit G
VITSPLQNGRNEITHVDDDELMSNEPTLTSLRPLRWMILGLSAALSIALIVRGNVLIGGLIGALVVARSVLFVRVHRRREELRRRFGRRWEQRR